MTLRAIIFDFDGTILETEGPEYQSWKQVYADYGVNLPASLWMRVIGSDFEVIGWDPYTYLAEQSGQTIDKDAIRAKRRPLHAELVAQQPIMPGVQALINGAQAHGLSLAVASSSPRTWVEGHLNRLGLRPYFAAIRTRDDVANIKPAPDLFLAAAQALDVKPAQTIVLEDSANGIKAAKTAGARAIAIPHVLTAQADFSLADRVVGSLTELTIEELIQTHKD